LKPTRLSARPSGRNRPFVRQPYEAERAPSAIATAAQLAAGTLDAATLLTETYARIDAVDATLRAFTARLDLPTALAQLPALKGPLQGLPVAVKDIFDTCELPTRYGSTLYPAEPARFDAAIVSVIRRAGGLVIGKSSTTEFAFLQPTATLNPNAPRPHTGRLISRLGGGGGGGPGAFCHRHANRRLRDPSGVLLRRHRLQAQLRPAAHAGAQMLFLVARHRGPVRRQRAEAAWFAASAQRPGTGA
jgi:hypothetical protein